jgi:hypothetical protein
MQGEIMSRRYGGNSRYFFVDDELLLFGSTSESKLSRYFKTISTFILE